MESESFPCPAQVQVPSGHPEPDFESDLWLIVDCPGVATTVGAGWKCTNGHEYRGMEAELGAYGLEWEREQADRNGY